MIVFSYWLFDYSDQKLLEWGRILYCIDRDSEFRHFLQQLRSWPFLWYDFFHHFFSFPKLCVQCMSNELWFFKWVTLVCSASVWLMSHVKSVFFFFFLFAFLENAFLEWGSGFKAPRNRIQGLRQSCHGFHRIRRNLKCSNLVVMGITQGILIFCFSSNSFPFSFFFSFHCSSFSWWYLRSKLHLSLASEQKYLVGCKLAGCVTIENSIM